MVPANYTHTNSKGRTYYLNTKKVTLRGGHEHDIYFFSKEETEHSCPLPAGKRVVENPRNGFLVVANVDDGKAKD
jgi:hypothetical protein